MRYEIQFRPKALRDLRHLSPDVSRRIEKKLDLLCNDLTGDVKRLVEYTSGWRLRVGDWRVLFQLSGRILVIHRIVHRSDAYD
jgi:mRNA interferase RelE/StbE